MSRVNEILDNPEIAQFLATHQGAEMEIRNAAIKLEDKPDAEAALKKLCPALDKKVIFVFFSYKKKDEDAAKAVVDLLQKKSAEKLKITYQAEFTEKIVGEKWRDWIQEAIKKANWFILLLPDPADDWDWCLYETGLFEAHRTSADRLICLHHPDIKIPDQIEGYHAVAATVPEVERFLKLVFVDDHPIPGLGPVNKSIESEIHELATKFVDAIRGPIKVVRKIYEPWIELHIDNPAELQSRDQLDQALVRAANQKALDLFDLLEKKPTWGEFRCVISEAAEDIRWREELFKTIQKVGLGHKYDPIKSVFKTHDGKMYRPVVCAVDRAGEDGPIETFHLTFAEDVATLDSSAMPKELSVLANILRFAFRFRWEVLKRFGKSPMTEEDVVRLDNTLNRIQMDWESRDIGGQDEILNLFSQEAHRRIISEMFDDWLKARNPEGTGELDIALKNKSAEKIQAILATFLPMNKKFLEMAADRFAELVSG